MRATQMTSALRLDGFTRLSTGWPTLRWAMTLGLIVLQRCHIDHKAVLHVILEHPGVSCFNILHFDHLDIRGDAVLGAEIQHLLGLGDAADQRAGDGPAFEHQIEYRRRRMWA